MPFFTQVTQLFNVRVAGSPKVRVAVVGEGTARVFHEVSESDDQSLELAFSPSKGILTCSFYYVLGAMCILKTLCSSGHLQIVISVNQLSHFFVRQLWVESWLQSFQEATGTHVKYCTLHLQRLAMKLVRHFDVQ